MYCIPGVQGDVSGGGEVGGHNDGVVVGLDVKDVNLLTEAVDDVEVVRDPVHRDRFRLPSTGHTENNKIIKYVKTFCCWKTRSKNKRLLIGPAKIFFF